MIGETGFIFWRSENAPWQRRHEFLFSVEMDPVDTRTQDQLAACVAILKFNRGLKNLPMVIGPQVIILLPFSSS
jgi:hypothetical protein